MADLPSSPPPSSTEKMSMNKRQRLEKPAMAGPCFIVAMNDDLLQNILSRLPAKSFAFASCVSRSWNLLCSRILSRPKFLSAFSLGIDIRITAKEVLDKVFSEAIRPDFVIANVMGNVRLDEALNLIVERVGSRVPIIVSRAPGILGKEACSDMFKEVKWIDSVHDDTCIASGGANFAILLTVGYMPGLKIDFIPLVQAKKEPQATIATDFVMDIRAYVTTVSDQAAPVGIILFGAEDCDMKPIMERLDCAMPLETFILGEGDEEREFVYNSISESRNVQAQLHRNRCSVRTSLGGLIFARDRKRTSCTSEIQFHTFISSGVSPVGPRYKAASVRESSDRSVVYLTARREGQPEIIRDGEEILNVIDDLTENDADIAYPYIGVIKRRNCLVGSEKPRQMTSLVFHDVMGGDEHYLVVEGSGIRTGDRFQLYYPSRKAALASVINVSSQLRNLKTKLNNSADRKETEFFGGFIFACYGRGKSFFGHPNTDSSPLLQNFPGLPFGGIFCGGEIGRTSLCLPAADEGGRGEIKVRQCLHFYSTVYLLMSYTNPC